MAEDRRYFQQWRKHAGLTQRQVVALLCELHPADADDEPGDDAATVRIPRTEASLSRIENGLQVYTSRTLLALAEIYKCETWELIGRDPSNAADLTGLLRNLSATMQLQAAAVIEGLVLAEKRQTFTGAPDPTAPLRPRN